MGSVRFWGGGGRDVRTMAELMTTTLLAIAVDLVVLAMVFGRVGGGEAPPPQHPPQRTVGKTQFATTRPTVRHKSKSFGPCLSFHPGRAATFISWSHTKSTVRKFSTMAISY